MSERNNISLQLQKDYCEVHMSKVDKRTIEASYVRELVENYEKEYPTVFQVLSKYLGKNGYSNEQIQKIVDEEVFDTVISAMRYGDYLANVKDIMEKYASIEYKTLGEIRKYFEYILAKRYGVSESDVDVYEAIIPALKRLQKDNLVEIIDNPNHTGWKLYKYIG